MADILHRITIRATPRQVYAALTTSEGIAGWWTRDVSLESVVGGQGQFGFHERRVLTQVVVATLIPDRRVDWTVTASNAPGGWTGTRISFELAPQDGDTVLAFAHRGYDEAGEDFARVTTAWAYYLLSLRQYAQTGVGAPHPDVDFARATLIDPQAEALTQAPARRLA